MKDEIQEWGWSGKDTWRLLDDDTEGENRGTASNKLTTSLLEWSSIQFAHQNSTSALATGGTGPLGPILRGAHCRAEGAQVKNFKICYRGTTQ